VATGEGRFAHFLAENFGDYTAIVGIDNRKEPLALARQHNHNPKITFVLMDAAQLTFPDSSFDTVAIANSLHHLAQPEPVLSEMKRVLRPDGLFIIAEMFHDNLNPGQQSYELWHSLIAEINTALAITHKPTFARARLRKIFLRLGLSQTDIFELQPDAASADEAEHMAEFLKRIDRLLDEVRHHPDYHRFQQRAEELRGRIQEVGIAPPPQLWLIGRK